jgi:serine/threonine protein kinase
MKIPDSVPWRSTGTTLGGGGQGEVHLVVPRDQPQAPPSALKILKNSTSRQARERFRREIEAVKQLSDTRIVKIVDHAEPVDDFQFYVMEYHQGSRTLASIIFSESNPYHGKTVESLALFEQLLGAISVCENAAPKIVHRDINPNNILVRPDGSIMLIDFGICLVQDNQLLTLVDENVGARNYTAPECESGNDSAIGVHSDLYSAGKVLWSTVVSQKAFSREEPAFSSRSMQQLFPLKPTTWHLTRLFERTIRANPDDRAQKASSLLSYLSELNEVIECGYPPLERIQEQCPSCGWRALENFPAGHMVFGNPNPSGVRAFRCSICGFGFVRQSDLLSKNIERLKNLR